MQKKWLELEHLVTLIEKSISPDSIVDHDVKLPMINSPSGAKSQCDIVIRAGKSPRETISIVEVQNRNKRVNVNDFRGWIKKVEDVGAQHLICVSLHDYPESVKEIAVSYGQKIRLVKLQELKVDNIPFDLFNVNYEYEDFSLKSIKKLDIGYSKSELEELGILDNIDGKDFSKVIKDQNTKCWSLEKKKMVSLFILCRDFYNPPNGKITGDGAISFNLKNGQELFMYESEFFYRVRMDCEFKWSKKIFKSPISVLSYEQIGDGSLAWVAEVFHNSPVGIISCKMPVVKSDGKYICGGIIAKLPPNVSLDIEFI